MQSYETNDQGAAEGVATREAAEEPFEQDTEQNGPTSGGKVLARVRDLDEDCPDPDVDKRPGRSEGRWISRALSMKLLVGGGILLLLAAVIPLMLNRKVEGEGGKPPRPHEGLAPNYDPEKVQNLSGQPTTPGGSYRPNLSVETQIPAGPAFTNTSSGTGENTSSQNGSWTPPPPPPWKAQPPKQPALGPSEQVPHVSGRTPSAATAWDSRGQNPDTGRQSAVGWPNSSQPPAANTPRELTPPPAAKRSPLPETHRPPDNRDASGYGGRFETNRPAPDYYRNYRPSQPDDTRPQSRANEMMTINGRPEAIPGGYRTEIRPEYRAAPQVNNPHGYRAVPQSSYRPQPVYPLVPGVARLDGTIEKLPVRTTDDRARPGLY